MTVTITTQVTDNLGATTTAVATADTSSGAPIIPANRTTLWQPGVTFNGGFPNRTTVYKTLSPSGGDDTTAIQSALNTCPANQIVQLAAGTFKINNNGLSFRTSNITLRGSGPGTGATGGVLNNDGSSNLVGGGTGTFLLKADRQSNPSYEIMSVGWDPSEFSTSTNLASDAIQGTNSLTLVSNPGIKVGEIVLVDHIGDNDPNVFWGLAHDGPGGGSRRWFMRQDRSLNQMMEVTAVSGNTITFATPFHCTFKTSFTAQVARYLNPFLFQVGIESICFMGGMGGDWHGNLDMVQCAYSWIKNCEGYWSVGNNFGIYGCYRCELRDSYIHGTPDPNPGGGGYNLSLNYGASDCLVENNIMWFGNKEIVMRGTGGGNVVAYNYMDDAFGSTYPSLPEAGANAGHYTTPHMELLEGNYSQNYKGDAFWGNSINITVFRNHLSGIRAAHSPLNTYTSNQGGTIFPYKDLGGRTCVDVQAHSFNTNFVGNVLGFQGQTLLTYNSPSYSFAQTSWLYENLSNSAPDNVVTMWNIGAQQNPNGWTWVATTFQTQLRQGNWDWFTQTQRWHGIGGAVGSGIPQPIPNSLYLTSKPAFFGTNPWPWVNPANGVVTTLPAKARFEAGTPNKVL